VGRGRTIVVTLDGLFRVKLKTAWLPTPFASFPFTSPPVRRRVPPDSVSTLPMILQQRTLSRMEGYRVDGGGPLGSATFKTVLDVHISHKYILRTHVCWYIHGMYPWLYVRVYACMHICMLISLYASAYRCILYTYVCMLLCMYVCVCVHACFVCVCACVRARARVLACIYRRQIQVNKLNN